MKEKNNIAFVILLLFIAISLFQHSKYFNLDIQGIHSWRQSQTMWNIRNFVRHDNCILNPRINSFNGGKDNIQRYEFPLMQWSIAQFQKIFSEDIRIVRVSIFLIGLITILTFTLIIKDIFDDWPTAVFSSILLQFSPLFYFYTINPIPDNLALAFSFLYILFILKHRKTNKKTHLVIASLALMMATLCKLPFLMVSILSIWFFLKNIFNGASPILSLRNYALPQFIFLLPAIAWYFWVMPSWTGNPILTGQLDEQFIFEEYLNIGIYHLTTMFPHILLSIPIWCILAIGVYGYLKNWRENKWLISLIGITFFYLILEFKPIGIVHDYYMFPFLIWLYILIAFGVSRILRIRFGIYIMLLICTISSVYTSAKMDQNWSVEKTYFNNDLFIYSEELKNLVPQSEHCIILNDKSGYIFSYKIDKMGHIFDSDNLPIEWIDDMVRNYGIKYMYSDSRKVDESTEFQNYISKIIAIKGSIKVIELKIPDNNHR